MSEASNHPPVTPFRSLSPPPLPDDDDRESQDGDNSINFGDFLNSKSSSPEKSASPITKQLLNAVSAKLEDQCDKINIPGPSEKVSTLLTAVAPSDRLEATEICLENGLNSPDKNDETTDSGTIAKLDSETSSSKVTDSGSGLLKEIANALQDLGDSEEGEEVDEILTPRGFMLNKANADSELSVLDRTEAIKTEKVESLNCVSETSRDAIDTLNNAAGEKGDQLCENANICEEKCLAESEAEKVVDDDDFGDFEEFADFSSASTVLDSTNQPTSEAETKTVQASVPTEASTAFAGLCPETPVQLAPDHAPSQTDDWATFAGPSDSTPNADWSSGAQQQSDWSKPVETDVDWSKTAEVDVISSKSHKKDVDWSETTEKDDWSKAQVASTSEVSDKDFLFDPDLETQPDTSGPTVIPIKHIDEIVWTDTFPSCLDDSSVERKAEREENFSLWDTVGESCWDPGDAISDATEIGDNENGTGCKRELWWSIRFVEEAAGLLYQWSDRASAYHAFLSALHMDLQMAKLRANPHLPAFAAHLRPAALQPLPAAAGQKEDGKHSVVFPASSLQPTTSAAVASSSSTSAGIDSLSVPPVNFDWGDSGLQNPLTSDSVTKATQMLDLDFLAMNDSANQTSALEKDLRSLGLDTPVSNQRSDHAPSSSKQGVPSTKGDQSTSDPLGSLLASAKNATFKPSLVPKESLSAEAKTVLDRLTPLEFMLSPVLMFPIKQSESS